MTRPLRIDRLADLLDAVVRTIGQIEDNLEIGAVLDPSGLTRRALVPGFPYQVVYHLTPADIVVVAVAHLRRRPGYWRDR